MRSTSAPLNLFVLGALACIFSLVPAKPILAEELPPSSKPYSASIEVQNTNTISYGDPIFISVRMTPLRPIDIESIALIPQGELAKLYGTTITSEAGSVVPKWPCSFGSSVRPAGIPFFVSCEIRPSFRNSQYFAIDTLLLPVSRHKLLLQFKHVSAGSEQEQFDEVFVDVVPTKASVMVGAFVGALVLSLFGATYRRQGAAPIWTWQQLRDVAIRLPFHVIEVVRQSLLATACALILILLADLSDGGQPPISLNVEDFWGGVIVGLFSVPLAHWIAARLSSIKPEPDELGEGADTNDGLVADVKKPTQKKVDDEDTPEQRLRDVPLKSQGIAEDGATHETTK